MSADTDVSPLWKTSDIAEYVGIAPNKVLERIASNPSFPKRIELPIATGGKMQPRWKARDVIAWVDGYAS